MDFENKKVYELLNGIQSEIAEFYFIDEPPGKLIGCKIVFSNQTKIEIYFRDIKYQNRININRDWDFQSLKSETISTIKIIE